MQTKGPHSKFARANSVNGSGKPLQGLALAAVRGMFLTEKDPLPLRLWHRALQRRFTMAHPIIDADECIACGVCVDACPAGVLELNDVATVADEDSCVACGACQDACPAGAITEIAED